MLPQDFEEGIRALILGAAERVTMSPEERTYRIRDIDDWLDELRKEGEFEAFATRWGREPKQTPEEKRRAEERGRRLLFEMLTPEQREEFDRRKCFHISVGDRRFRLTPGKKAVEIDARGKKIRYFCAHPQFVPPSDQVLTQKLLLENDPEAFFKTANKTEYRQPFGRNKTWDKELRKTLVSFVIQYMAMLREVQRKKESEEFSRRIREALDEGLRRYREEKEMNRAAELAQRFGPNGNGMLPSECEEIGVPMPRGYIPVLIPDALFDPIEDEPAQT